MGKKKKSVANKLARMSDEERMRYLQHRSDMEEEAKRRKEQLISTFIKNKIKKEDAFSRLNLAKINQHWHQILRKTKCTEMKETVEHMRRWIDRLVSLKNRTIDKLIEELDEAELQYGHNLKHHMLRMDKIIDSHNSCLQKLGDYFDKERLSMLDLSSTEQQDYVIKNETEQNYLKTMIFGQKIDAQKQIQLIGKDFSERHDDIICMNRALVEKTHRDCESIMNLLWKQVTDVVAQYVRSTDQKRAHLAELKRLDAESNAEIATNEEHIKKEENMVNSLKGELASVIVKRQDQVRFLKKDIETLTIQVSEMRKQLQFELKKDEKQLRHLTNISFWSIKLLDDANWKGEQIKYLIRICHRLETENDKITKYLPPRAIEIPDEDELADHLKTESEKEDDVETGSLKDTKEQSVSERNTNYFDINTISPKLNNWKVTLNRADPVQLVSKEVLDFRPKTAVMKELYNKSLRKDPSPYNKDDQRFDVQGAGSPERVVMKAEVPKSPPTSFVLSERVLNNKKEILNSCFDNLRDVEKFWTAYNKVQLDVIELKAERKILIDENKQLREMMRAVLEASALGQSIPHSRMSTKVPSRSRATQ